MEQDKIRSHLPNKADCMQTIFSQDETFYWDFCYPIESNTFIIGNFTIRNEIFRI